MMIMLTWNQVSWSGTRICLGMKPMTLPLLVDQVMKKDLIAMRSDGMPMSELGALIRSGVQTTKADRISATFLRGDSAINKLSRFPCSPK